MNKSNIHIPPLMIEVLTGVLLVAGVGFVVASTIIYSQVQAALEGMQRVGPMLSDELIQEALHGAAAVPLLMQQVQTSYLLTLGMCMILAGYMLYAVYVVNRRQAAEGRPMTMRIRQWFARSLDRSPRVYHMHLTAR